MAQKIHLPLGLIDYPALKNSTLFFHKSKLFRYGFSILTSGVALLLTQWLRTYSFRYTSLFFLAAVVLTATIAGLGPAALATIINVVLILIFIIPAGSAQNINELLSVAIFAFVAIFTSFLSLRRQESEHRLMEQRQWLFTTLSSIGDAVITTNKKNTITFMNTSAEQLTGWTQEEAVGLELNRVVDLRHERTLRAAPHSLAHSLTKKNTGAAPLIVIARNGKTTSIEKSVAPIKDTTGRILGMVSIFSNVNERRQAQENREKLATIVESSGDAILSQDLNSTITSWNPAAKQMFGYTNREVIGKPMTLLVAPTKKQRFLSIVKKVKESKNMGRYELVGIKKDGEYFEMSLSISPMKNSSGKVIGASTIIRDVTERNRRQALEQHMAEASSILASSLNYRATLAQIAQLAVPEVADWCAIDLLEGDQIEQLVIAHSDPEIVSLAQEWRKFFPISINDPHGIGLALRSGKSQVYPIITDQMIQKAAKNKHQLEILKSIAFRSSMVIPFSIRDKVIGSITYVFTQSSDRHFNRGDVAYAEELADRIAVSIDNAKLFAASEEAVRARDEFLSIASHELKTPITSIKAFIQILQLHFKKRNDPESEKLLQRAEVQVSRLISLISDLLDVTKIQAGKLAFHWEKCDLESIISEVVADFETTTKTHTIVKEGSSKKLVECDCQRIAQVLNNLISNAIKYSPHANKVIVTVSSTAKEVIVHVTDFGFGIPKEKQSHVFERFFRGEDEHYSKLASLGLGLYISAEIVHRHRGRIWLESKEGEGSTFSFALPFKQD